MSKHSSVLPNTSKFSAACRWLRQLETCCIRKSRNGGGGETGEDVRERRLFLMRKAQKGGNLRKFFSAFFPPFRVFRIEK
jgi:hypothetical protein